MVQNMWWRGFCEIMTRSRSPEKSKELHEYVSSQWMFFGRNAYQISDQINKDTELMSKFGKTSPAGIHYHVKQIQEEMENSISEDAMDTYIGEFIRARLGFEQDVIALEEIMQDERNKGLDNMDKELYLKFARTRHEIKLDSFKMLQDSALPLQVKKLKMERAKLRPARPMPKVEDNGSSQ